jgi:heat-inducible transcriptional repressor
LTNYAAVVVAPRAQSAAVRSVQLVGLSSALATVVVVFGNGSVESQTIELAGDVSDVHLAAASARLSGALAGRPLGRLGPVPSSGDAVVDRVAQQALDAVSAAISDEHLYVGGTSSMASAFDAVEIVRDVLRTLEQQFVVVTLVSDLVQRGLSVAIGGEHGVQPLSACSVVVAPIVVDGEPHGSVGVLGPTRMNYPQALATVEVVSNQLARRMEES